MVSHLLYYQLALLTLLWLFVLLHLSWPKRTATSPPGPATPIKPKRKRSLEPQAFAGLPHKPPCTRGLCCLVSGAERLYARKLVTRQGFFFIAAVMFWHYN